MNEVYLAGTKRSIDTGNTYFDEISKSSVSGHGSAKQKLKRDNIRRLPVSDKQPLKARAEYGKWIVDCPNCGSAEFYFEDKLFFCSQCLNSNIEGKALIVKMPKGRKKIEEILGKRPIKNRHWFTNETVEDLERENISHKLEVI